MASKGGETSLYGWTQRKDEVLVTIKPPVDSAHLELGKIVMIHGLKKAPQFNWTSALVCGPLKNGRFRVQCLRSDHKEINVRPANLCIKPLRGDIKVEFKSKELVVRHKGKKILSGKLKNLIITDECTWYMAEGLPEILLSKDKADWWSGVIEGDPEIDIDIAEGETFLDENMMSRLKAKKAQQKAREMAQSDKPHSLETLCEFYNKQIQREKSEYKKKFETRAFALWTRKARRKAGLSLDYRGVGSVCSPIRCVENKPKCTLREKLDYETMDGLQEEARKETKKAHENRLKGLHKRLDIVTSPLHPKLPATNKENTSPNPPNPKSEKESKEGGRAKRSGETVEDGERSVRECDILPVTLQEAWSLVFPIDEIIAPGRILTSSCRKEHKNGSSFKVKYKSGVRETFMIRSLDAETYTIQFEVIRRTSHVVGVENSKHTIHLKDSKFSDPEEMSGVLIEMESIYGKGASQELLVESQIAKLDAFDWIRNTVARRRLKEQEKTKDEVEGKEEIKKETADVTPKPTKEDQESGTAPEVTEIGGDEKVCDDGTPYTDPEAVTKQTSRNNEQETNQAIPNPPRTQTRQTPGNTPGQKSENQPIGMSGGRATGNPGDKKFWAEQNIEMLN